MDEELYREYQYRKWFERENLCNKCGNCCGLKDQDPCEHLRLASDGTYFCGIYEKRFGTRKTVKGNEIECAPIRNIIHKTWPGQAKCAYVRALARTLAPC